METHGASIDLYQQTGITVQLIKNLLTAYKLNAVRSKIKHEESTN
jgi:hypothetical protein